MDLQVPKNKNKNTESVSSLKCVRKNKENLLFTKRKKITLIYFKI